MRYKILYMCKMHKNLSRDKNKRNHPEKPERKKSAKKCRIEAELRQEKGLHVAKAR